MTDKLSLLLHYCIISNSKNNISQLRFFVVFLLFPQTPGREYVGFATLPDQVHRKSVKKGFEFTLMVVGKSYKQDRFKNKCSKRADSKSLWPYVNESPIWWTSHSNKRVFLSINIFHVSIFSPLKVLYNNSTIQYILFTCIILY